MDFAYHGFFLERNPREKRGFTVLLSSLSSFFYYFLVYFPSFHSYSLFPFSYIHFPFSFTMVLEYLRPMVCNG